CAFGGKQVDPWRWPCAEARIGQPARRVLRLEEQHLVEEHQAYLEVAAELELRGRVVERVRVSAGIAAFHLRFQRSAGKQRPRGHPLLPHLRAEERAEVRRVRGAAVDLGGLDRKSTR